MAPPELTTAHPPSMVNPGDVVEGRYRILSQLADGGMGTVFLAEHVLIKRRVAIKVLHADLAADRDVIKRFMNEALAAGTLGHPNIVESTDMGFTPEGVPFIVFEYLEGALLSEEIYRTGGMSIRRTLACAIQIAAALEAAHHADIVHLDLKSDNVFLTDKDGVPDRVKVLDFGISKFMEPDGERTQRGMIVGTPEYMAPEQIETPDDVDKRADIYALGVVLYEMIAARRPFDNTDPRLLLHRICNEPAPALGREDVPPQLVDMLFGRLLAKSRTQRLQTMQEVRSELEAIASRHGRESGPISIAPPTRADLPFASGSSIALPSAVAAVALPTAPRRIGVGWLGAAVLIAGAGVGAHVLHRRAVADTGESAIAALRVDAEKIAATLTSEARAARLRLDGLASAPMVRIAIETDAATVRDMARNESLFKRGADETLELLQLQLGGAVPTSLVRIPEQAPATPGIASAASLAKSDGVLFSTTATGAVMVTVAETVVRQDNTPGGLLVLAAPVDLTLPERLVAQDATSARLEGLGAPITLVPATSAPGAVRSVQVPVPIDHAVVPGVVTLAAMIRVPTANPALGYARLAAFGLSFLCLLGFARSVRRPS